MAISTNKINKIIAEWKTGAYKKSQLISKHKIDRKTLNKFIGDLDATNADIVEICTVAENAKNSLQSPYELKAVDEVVKSRLQVSGITNTILKEVKELLKGGKAQKVLTDGSIVEYNLQAKDYRDLQEAVDKASLTLGVNARHSSTNMQVNTQVNNNPPSLEDFYEN